MRFVLSLILVLSCSSALARGDVGSRMPPATMHDRPETRCIVQAAQFHEVNPWILRAILKTESGFNANAVNKNANGTIDVGMAQINSAHFRELSKYGVASADLKDACVATYVAAWHLAKKIKQYGNTWTGIASYHSATKCFNVRYQGLIWNQLVDWSVVQGQKIKTNSLAQCGYKAPSQSANLGHQRSNATMLAFDQ